MKRICTRKIFNLASFSSFDSVLQVMRRIEYYRNIYSMPNLDKLKIGFKS